MDIFEKLEFYGLWMQIERGDIIGKRPGIHQVESRLKYDAWEDVTERNLNQV